MAGGGKFSASKSGRAASSSPRAAWGWPWMQRSTSVGCCANSRQRFRQVQHSVANIRVREVDVGHSAVPPGNLDPSSQADVSFWNAANDREDLLHPGGVVSGGFQTRSLGVQDSALKPIHCFFDSTNRKGIPNHRVRRTHVPAYRELRPGPRCEKLDERLFARADVGDEDPCPSLIRLTVDSLDQLQVLRQRTPDSAGSSGDGALQELRPGEVIPTEAIDEHRSNSTHVVLAEDVKVFHLEIATEEPLDDVLILVIPPETTYKGTSRRRRPSMYSCSSLRGHAFFEAAILSVRGRPRISFWDSVSRSECVMWSRSSRSESRS